MARSVEFDEDQAIQRATEVFWKKGYKGASLRDLTDAMKISTSSLYNTLGDKHELFVKCIQQYTHSRSQDLRTRAASSKSPLAILVKYVNDAARSITSGAESCMAVKAAFEVAAEDKRIRDILKADSDSVYRFISSLITKAIDEGEMSADEDPEVLTDHFISTYIGWQESFILHKNPAKIKKMAQYFVKQLSR